MDRQKRGVGDTPSRPRLLIGIVEDDLAVLHSLEFALQAEGYDVCALASAAAASRSSELMGADCLIVDYALPDGTGVALLLALRRRGLRCPAIVIASNPTAQCRRDSRVVGAPLIEKPLMGEALSAAIQAALVGAS